MADEEWEEVTTTVTVSEMASTAPPSVVSGFSKETASGSGSELAMVVSRNTGKDLVEIVKEVDDYFLKAADAGGQLSCILEISSPNLSSQNKGGWSLICWFLHFFLSYQFMTWYGSGLICFL